MVIRGATRGNGKQLANYLLSDKENDNIRILDINGKADAGKTDLHYSLLEWSLMSELTKSDSGLYHAQINPAYGFDKTMTAEDWNKAADILAKHLGFEGQRRAIVLHEKKDRIHGHVVFERYDHVQGTMKDTKWNYLAHDRARREMEHILQHDITPRRNVKQPEIKADLSQAWQQSRTGQEFIKAAKAQGYTITDGYTTSGNKMRPFGVVDKEGRSFDLARQIDGAKTKDIREKLQGEKLPKERAAVVAARSRQDAKSFDRAQEAANDNKAKFQYTQKVKDQERQQDKTYQFKYQAEQQTTDKSKQQQERAEKLDDMKQAGQHKTETPEEKRLREFREQWTKSDKSQSQEQAPPANDNKQETEEEKRLREFREQWNRPENDQDKDFGLEIDDYEY